jgi:hypothetical protein
MAKIKKLDVNQIAKRSLDQILEKFEQSDKKANNIAGKPQPKTIRKIARTK